jgi:hypothetical protein
MKLRNIRNSMEYTTEKPNDFAADFVHQASMPPGAPDPKNELEMQNFESELMKTLFEPEQGPMPKKKRRQTNQVAAFDQNLAVPAEDPLFHQASMVSYISRRGE